MGTNGQCSRDTWPTALLSRSSARRRGEHEAPVAEVGSRAGHPLGPLQQRTLPQGQACARPGGSPTPHCFMAVQERIRSHRPVSAEPMGPVCSNRGRAGTSIRRHQDPGPWGAPTPQLSPQAQAVTAPGNAKARARQAALPTPDCPPPAARKVLPRPGTMASLFVSATKPLQLL